MMKHKKITLIVMLIVLLTFTGCAQVNIDTGVDKDYNAYLSYQVEVDLSSIDTEQVLSATDALNTLVEHYETNLGFEVIEKKTDFLQNVYRYEVLKKIPNYSYEEAFNTLQEMLTDEKITPFMQVDMTSKITNYQQLYAFKGELDFGTVYTTTNIGSFPQYMQDTIEQQFNDSKGEVHISLPGMEIENVVGGKAAVENGQVNMTVPFELRQKTAVELSTRLTVDGERTINLSMNDVLQSLTTSLRLWIAICVVASVAIIVGIALLVRKEKVKDIEIDNPKVAIALEDDTKIDT